MDGTENSGKKRKNQKLTSDDKGRGGVAKGRGKTGTHVDQPLIRVRGPDTDPLNLQGLPGDFECPTCAPSPASTLHQLGDQPSPLPSPLQGDPLNLEEKVVDYQEVVARVQHHSGESRKKRKREEEKSGKKRRRTQERTKSNSESTEEMTQHKLSVKKKTVFRYGNYDRYYGHRVPGHHQEDPRLKLLKKEWFEGKQCLDIGCNAGYLTISLARLYSPSRITGIDIDGKLVRMSWKNLQHYRVPAVAPDGRVFPQSFLINRVPPPSSSLSDTACAEDGPFPDNIEFIQGNYVPSTEAELLKVEEQYDVILCLSLTKWVHLNWGDNGVRLLFRKIYHHLRPGGRFLLEPQPWKSYERRMKLTPLITANYRSITFYPHQFQSYLMSREVGFTEHQYLGISDNKSKGFQRPMHMYIKGPVTTSPNESQTTP